MLESRVLLARAIAGWTPLDALPRARGLTSDLNLTAYKAFSADASTLARSLGAAGAEDVAKYGVGRGAKATVVNVPRPDGTVQRFSVVESSLLTGATAKKYGATIKTYAGYGIDDPTAYARLDLTPQGFHAQVLTPTAGGSYYVDPYYKQNNGTYVSYFSGASVDRGPTIDHDDLAELGLPEAAATAGRTSGNGGANAILRTYRLAVAATGEYTAFFGGTVAAGQAAIVTAINRVTGIYEMELGIRLALVANNSSLVYTNAGTDPYTNNDPNALLSQNQANVDAVIGSANYDIGHVFSTGGGGLAGLGVVGINGNKARAETGLSNPTGDGFYVDYVAHEMGHQFGGGHTFNTSSDPNRSSANAYEPGSGSTIMAYAGITSDDIQSFSDPYFAWRSIDQILAHCDVTIPSVGVRTSTTNRVPTVSGGPNYTIPSNTPFTLTATGSDPDGDTVYYSWEQADLGAAATLEQGDLGNNPLFRVYNPTTSPSRTFPVLSTVLAGLTQTPGGEGPVESLPTTSRAMKFYPVVRDRRAGAGGTNVTTGTFTTVTSVAAASTFAVTSFNGATTVAGGSQQTITWNVAGTTANGINTANVSILMSLDGGQTFNVPLAAATANDGSETVTLPFNTGSSQVRFKVAAVGNIYFDISNANVTLTNVPAPVLDIATSADAAYTYANGTITVTAGTVTFLSDASARVANLNVIVNNNAKVVFNTTQILGSLSLNGTSTATLVAGGTRVLRVASLSVAPTAALDLTNNFLVVDYADGAASPFSTLRGQIITGRAGGNWTGPGIRSSTAANDATRRTGLGHAEASTYKAISGSTTFGGLAVDNSAVVVRFTSYGDATLNGTVDVADLGILATNYGASTNLWTSGNFDDDDAIGVADLGLLATGYGASV